MKKSITLFCVTFVTIASLCAQKTKVESPKPYGAIPTAAQLQWHEMEMYAFVHFSINTFTNKEWGYGDENPAIFNPTNFDADAIAKIVKSAGLKGIVFTCKHHDGFCLWPTKSTEHNISKSPWKDGKGDMVKEISDACKRNGLKFGVYLSPWDRNNKNYGKPEYINVYRQQYRELLTNYGPLFESWHDGANGGDGYYGGAKEQRFIDKSTYYDWENTWKILAELQPNAVIFSDIGPGCRWVGNEQGYAKDPCWSTITFEPTDPNQKLCPGIDIKNLETGTHNGNLWVPAEVDFSIRPGWFWHESQNSKVKTTAQLLDHYFMSVGRGANMILNIPPDKRGRIYETDSVSLASFGNVINEMYSLNAAQDAKATASNVRGNSSEFAASKVLDNDRYSYWATDDNVKDATLTLNLKYTSSFNVIRLRENIKLGQRVNKWEVEVMQNGEWKQYASGQAIGSCRLIRGKKVTTDKIRLRIINADACPCISEFSMYFEQVPCFENGNILSNTSSNKEEIIYATDRTKNKISPLVSRSRFKNQTLTVDLNETTYIKGFTYFPPKGKATAGLIEKYNICVSLDGKNWETVAEGEFSNIKNNPIEQVITFKKAHPAKYIQLLSMRTVDYKKARINKIGITLEK